MIITEMTLVLMDGQFDENYLVILGELFKYDGHDFVSKITPDSLVFGASGRSVFV
jgi:hypothetical protein